MGELYEGIVVRGERPAVRDAFDAIRSPLTLRLVHLTDSVFGIYRVAAGHDPFNPDALIAVTKGIASRLGHALAVFYDNRGGARAAALCDGSAVREFGEADELWVPLDEAGFPMMTARRRRAQELEPEGEYDCIVSALDLGLEALNVRASVSPALLKDAFCYERFS